MNALASGKKHEENVRNSMQSKSDMLTVTRVIYFKELNVTRRLNFFCIQSSDIVDHHHMNCSQIF